MQAYGFTAKDVKRIGAAVRKSEGARDQRPQRARYPVPSPTTYKSAIVTTENCCVDAFDLSSGVLIDSRGRRYVEGEFVDPLTGDPEGDTIRIFPTITMQGFLHKGLYVRVLASSGGYVVHGNAQLTADAEVETAISTTTAGTVLLFPDDETDGVIEVSGVLCHSFCDQFLAETAVVVNWFYNPVEATSWLYVADACCTPVVD